MAWAVSSAESMAWARRWRRAVLAALVLGLMLASSAAAGHKVDLSRRPVPAPVWKAAGTATSNPSQNVQPNPDFLGDCSGSGYDDSASCVDATLQAIDNARSLEGLGVMNLPSDWSSLTPQEQLFVVTNLERTARSLPPLSGMASALDQSAAAAAAQSQDPVPPSGFPWTEWGGNWAGAVGNPLEAMYFWMYDDGMNSGNLDCTPSNTSGCWGHRDNVLMSLSCQPCLMGSGFDSTGYYGYPSWSELLVDAIGNQQLDFSWSQVVGYLGTAWSASSGQPDLLADPSFQSSLGPWGVSPGQNWATYQSFEAPAGGGYLETNAGSSRGPNLYQDTSKAPLAGRSYQASVELRASSPGSIGVALVVWAMGGSAELAQSDFTVSSTQWSRFTTDLDVINPGHVALRFQLFFDGGPGLDVSDALLQDAGVTDAGFQGGKGSWAASPGQNWAVYPSAASPVGGDYLETNSGSSSSPSLYQNVQTSPLVGHDYQGSVFLRASSVPVSVSLVVWGLGGATELGQTNFTVSSTSWTQYFADLDVAQPGHNGLRLQLYFSTGAGLDVGAAMVQDTGIRDAGFDQRGLGPWTVQPGANWANGSGGGTPAGNTDLLTNTGNGSTSSIYQDMPTHTIVGHPYTGSVYLKSSGAPVNVAVVIWAIGGGSPTEVGQTLATVGSAWQQVSTELDVRWPGHTDLRFQIFVGGKGPTLALDLANVPDISADAS